MAKRTTEFTVGLFVAGGISLALIAIIWLGMSRVLEKGSLYAAYFNESVQGLNRDSPVKYRGVAVGRVESIEVAPDGKLIQVVMKMESGQKLDQEAVAQLKAVGITGSMFVELDRRKKGDPDKSPPLNFPSKFPIVATKPSDISLLLQGINDSIGQIKLLDLKGISDKLKQTLETGSRVMADADVKNISASVAAVLGKAGSTLTRVEKVVTDNERQIKAALEQLQTTLAATNDLLAKSSALVAGSDAAVAQMRPQLFLAVQNLEKTTEGLNRLVEQLGQQPSRLLYGRPPVPRREESAE